MQAFKRSSILSPPELLILDLYLLFLYSTHRKSRARSIEIILSFLPIFLVLTILLRL